MYYYNIIHIDLALKPLVEELSGKSLLYDLNPYEPAVNKFCINPVCIMFYENISSKYLNTYNNISIESI